MSFLILPAALSDLREIETWVVEHFGASFAIRTEARLFKTFELLYQFPNLGRTRPEVTSRSIRFYFFEHFWIAYTTGEVTLIHRIFHANRDARDMTL